MKKGYESEHSNIWKVYVSELSIWNFAKTNPFEKQNSKVWKVVTPSSIFTFFGNTTSQEEQKAFIDDLVLLIMKGLFLLNIVENIWMRWFGLQRDRWAMFPSCKTLTDDILPFMMKCTLQELVFPFINAAIFVITTFDLWINKGAFDIFTLVIFWLWIRNQNMSQLVCLRPKELLGLILLVNCKLCLKSINLLTRSFDMWKMKAQTNLQWPMFLNRLLLVKKWECKHHLNVFVLHMPFLKLANLPLLMKK